MGEGSTIGGASDFGELLALKSTASYKGESIRLSSAANDSSAARGGCSGKSRARAPTTRCARPEDTVSSRREVGANAPYEMAPAPSL